MKSGPSLVHVVDDDTPARQQTVAMLREQRVSTESWPSTADFLQHAGSVAPGCVLIDLCRPELDGRAIQQRLTDPMIGLPCVVLTDSTDLDAAVQAMRHGAIDFLRKPAEPERALAAIHIAFERLTKARRRAATMRRVTSVIELLSPRERQVLDGLVCGHSNKEIARNLSISARTVEIHRASMMEKMDAETLSQALRIAFIAQVCSVVNPALHVG